MPHRRATMAALLLLLVTTAASPAPRPLPFTGVNLAGGEFYHPRPGVRPVCFKDFVYPTAAEVDYFIGRGMNIVRLPFRWETLQPARGERLDPTELKRFAGTVRMITAKGCTVLIDPHNYARYYGKPIGGPDVSTADFADFWGRLAPAFAGDDHVWFGLVNEPHDVPADHWLSAANAAIGAIRAAGASNMILVPGIAWSGAHRWIASGNAAVMAGVVDPADHWAYEVHQYLDADSSGTKPVVVSPTIGSERLATFTAWCRARHRKAFLGEFAVPATPAGQAALADMLSSMENARDVWLGYTWWAAGAWWHNYMFSLEPAKDHTGAPQMAWLLPHLQGRR